MIRRNFLLVAALAVALFALMPRAYAVTNCPNPQVGTPGPWFIYFDIGSTTINAEGMAKIKEAAKRIHDWYIRGVCLRGNADKQGNAPSNQELSLKRAAAVEKALIREGVKPDIISTVGKGEAYGDWITMFQDSPQDRSVRITLTK